MQLTEAAKEKAAKAKAYIEKKYKKLGEEEVERKQGNACVHNYYIAWDKLSEKMMRLNLSEAEQELIKQDILHKEAELNRKM